jgi:hypothetical protein
MVVCSVPLSLAAENEVIDKGGFEFGLGTVFDLTLYRGNVEGAELTFGSGLSRFNFGYFVGNRISIGGTLYYNSWKRSGATEASRELGIGPYVRYYIPINEKTLFDITGIFQMYVWKDAGDTARSYQIFFGGTGGLTYLITNNLGFGGSIGFVVSPSYTDEGETIPDSDYVQIIFALGFTVYI